MFWGSFNFEAVKIEQNRDIEKWGRNVTSDNVRDQGDHFIDSNWCTLSMQWHHALHPKALVSRFNLVTLLVTPSKLRKCQLHITQICRLCIWSICDSAVLWLAVCASVTFSDRHILSHTHHAAFQRYIKLDLMLHNHALTDERT